MSLRTVVIKHIDHVETWILHQIRNHDKETDRLLLKLKKTKFEWMKELYNKKIAKLNEELKCLEKQKKEISLQNTNRFNTQRKIEMLAKMLTEMSLEGLHWEEEEALNNSFRLQDNT